MVETSKRSDLIRKQIETLINNAPPPLTQAERNQIMKGRKGQKSIDEGRAAIDARADELKTYNKQLDDLNKALGEAETQEGTAAEKAKREESADPISNIAIPAGAGFVGGGLTSYGLNKIVGAGDAARTNALIEIGREIGPTNELTNSQMNRSRAVGAAAAAEKYAPTSFAGKAGNFAKRAGTYAVPVGFIKYEYDRYNAIANDESRPWEERQSAARIANGLLGGFTGVGVEGTARFLNSKVAPGEGEAMMRINAARDFARRMDLRDANAAGENRLLSGNGSDIASTPLSRAPATPAAPSGNNTPNRLLAAPKGTGGDLPGSQTTGGDLPSATKAAGLPGGNGSDIASTPMSRLPSAPAAPDDAGPVTAGKAKSAATPGSKAWLRQQAGDLKIPGRTRMSKQQLADALAEASREHGGKRTIGKRTPKLPGMLGPAIGAGVAYMATPDDAQAADGSVSTTGRDEALTNAGIVGTGVYGMNRLLRGIGTAGRVAGGMMEPIAGMGIDPLEGATQEETAEKIDRARGQASYYAPWLAENVMGIPRSEGTAYDITQNPGNLPTPSPRRPAPGNPEYPLSGQMEMSQSMPEDFDSQIADLEAIFMEIANEAPASRSEMQGRPFPPAPMMYPQTENRLLRSY